MTEVCFRVFVPAKAMLWGEYGVLHGGPAVAVSIPQISFELHVIARKIPEKVLSEDTFALSVFSDFFPTGKLFLSRSQIETAFPAASRDEKFFAGICFPWSHVFDSWSVDIYVKRSFSPALGFGSSSALLVALHRTLARLAWGTPLIQNENVFWNGVFESLRRVQSGGSGYDVAVQNASMCFVDADGVGNCEGGAGCCGLRVWEYWRKLDVPHVSPLVVDNLAGFGVFLASHVYSDTRQALRTQGESADFALKHESIAREFLNKPTAQSLSSLMKLARDVGRAQGIIPQNFHPGDFAKLCSILDNLGVPWKHMGSGKGDCLWVLASREDLGGVFHPVTHKMLSQEVVFDFSTLRGSRDE